MTAFHISSIFSTDNSPNESNFYGECNIKVDYLKDISTLKKWEDVGELSIRIAPDTYKFAKVLVKESINPNPFGVAIARLTEPITNLLYDVCIVAEDDFSDKTESVICYLRDMFSNDYVESCKKLNGKMLAHYSSLTK